MNTRTLTPELLDSLPHDHPAARHSRSDLRRINALMGNHRWFARTLPRLLRRGESVLEIGAGSGELARRLHRTGVAADALDLCPPPADWPAPRAWHRADLRHFAHYDRYPVFLANLILHHLDARELAALGGALRPVARVILASEPARRRRFQWLYRLAGPLLGANRVTRHDAHVSIAAGFRHRELADALGLDDSAWLVRSVSTALGATRLVALRRS